MEMLHCHVFCCVIDRDIEYGLWLLWTGNRSFISSSQDTIPSVQWVILFKGPLTSQHVVLCLFLHTPACSPWNTIKSTYVCSMTCPDGLSQCLCCSSWSLESLEWLGPMQPDLQRGSHASVPHMRQPPASPWWKNVWGPWLPDPTLQYEPMSWWASTQAGLDSLSPP